VITPAKEILIVDDEVGIRELLSEILQDEGYRVSLAENATAARAYRARERRRWCCSTSGCRIPTA
jgi:DNA-binding NtrC family response regulator